jgi:hypothetical protein
MKKISLLLATTLVLALTSCSKDYVCVCTNSTTGDVSYGDHFKATIFAKKAAQESCKANNNLSAGGLENCHLE